MPLLHVLALTTALTALAADLTVVTASVSEQDADADVSTVLLLQQDMRLQPRNKVAAATGLESFEVGPGGVDEHDTNDAAALQVQVGYETALMVPAEVPSSSGAPTSLDAAPGGAMAGDTLLGDAELQHRADSGAAAVRTDELPTAILSVLETWHGAVGMLQSYSAVGDTGRVLAPPPTRPAVVNPELTAFIVMLLILMLVAATLTCLMAILSPPSQNRAQAQTLLQDVAARQRQAFETVAKYHPDQPPRRAATPGSAPGAPFAEARHAFPPPFCPTLILPHTEVRFMVAMGSLSKAATGSIDVVGTSGRKLLAVNVTSAEDGCRSMTVSSAGVESAPRAKVASSLPGVGLDLFGPQTKHYGTIQNISSTGTCLTCDGKRVLALECSDRADLVFTVSTLDGCELATAGRYVSAPGRSKSRDEAYEDSPERSTQSLWLLQVRPNVDAVLVATCVLSRIVMLPWQ